MARTKTAKGSVVEQGKARGCVIITPHDTDEIDATSGIVSNSGGDITCRFEDSDTDVTLTLNAGLAYRYSITHVRSTGTTTAANDLFGLY
jgi:hypothetical protein